MSPTLEPLRAELSGLPGPVIVFNKSHSGSRVVSALLSAGGVFMGAHRNESGDALDILDLVTPLVGRYYPDYSPLWNTDLAAEEELLAMAQRAFRGHLEGYTPGSGTPWGWKLCETTFILPVLDYCFPNARYVHLVRDGRDVAFSDHRGPSDDWWRKIYFNTDRIRTVHGLPLTGASYRRNRPIFNALHWVNAVTVGRNFGAMLRERCLEVRYEDLCLDFDRTARRVLAFAGAPDPEAGIRLLAPTIRVTSIGKYRQASRRDQQRVLPILKPLLLSLGYLADDPERPRPSVRSTLAHLRGRRSP